MKEIGELCRERKVFFHTDAAQAVGKVPVDVNADNIDLMSISAHKIYGPKGVGAIYVRRRPRVRLEAQISGGGQVCAPLFRGSLTMSRRSFAQLPGLLLDCEGAQAAVSLLWDMRMTSRLSTPLPGAAAWGEMCKPELC